MVRWRQAHAVELQILGPSGRAERERAQPAEWAFELRHAVALHLGAGLGEEYQAQVATRFASERSELARQAYEGFRNSRSEAVSALPRADPATQILTAAACVRDAARFWLLGLGEPHPAGKWLLHSLRRHPGTEPVLAAMELCLDIRQAADRRFQALWTLWDLVDTHAGDQPNADALLADSPFRKS